MKKVLILQASAKSKGTVATMANQLALDIQNTKKETQVEIIDVSKLKYNSCIGCMKCRSQHKCVFSGDEADVVGQKIADADVLVIASPVYWGNMPGTLKCLFDRNVFRMMGESSLGIPIPLMKGKKSIIFTACTTPFPFNYLAGQTSGLVKAIKEILKSSGIKITSVVAVAGTKTKNCVPKSIEKRIKRLAKSI